MSFCENSEVCPCNKADIDCPLDGFPSRVVNYVNNNDKAQLQMLAGGVWQCRGGGQSTKEQKDADYEKAMRLKKIYVYINKTTPNLIY